MALTYEQLAIDRTWEQFHETHGVQFRNRLIEHYLHLVKYTAERLISKLPCNVQLDDLISDGLFGLMEAIQTYDPERGVKFETYCWPRIKGSIFDEIRRQTGSRNRQRATRKADAPRNKGNNEHVLQNHDRPNVEINSLSKNIYNDEQDLLLIEIVTCKNDCEIERIDTKDLFERLCRGLSRQDSLLLKLYFLDGFNQKEAGDVSGHSESRISQKFSNLLPRIRIILENMRLHENSNDRRKGRKVCFAKDKRDLSEIYRRDKERTKHRKKHALAV